MKYSIELTDADDSRVNTEAYSQDELGEMLGELLDERGPGNYLITVEVTED